MVLMFPGSLWTTSITWSSCGKNLPWKWKERDLEPGECEPPDLCPWPSLQLLHMAVLYNYIQQNLKKSLVQSSTSLLSQLLFSHNALPGKKVEFEKKTPPYLVRSLVFLATEQQPFTRTFHLSWRRFDPMLLQTCFCAFDTSFLTIWKALKFAWTKRAALSGHFLNYSGEAIEGRQWSWRRSEGWVRRVHGENKEDKGGAIC